MSQSSEMSDRMLEAVWGGGFYCAVGLKQDEELGGIGAFASGTEVAADEGVDGLFELCHFGTQACVFIEPHGDGETSQTSNRSSIGILTVCGDHW